MKQISHDSEPLYAAIIATDYFGGMGEQFANLYKNDALVDANIKHINHALRSMGVTAKHDLDEFDTVGLSDYRSEPDYLWKYCDLAEELGV